MVAYDGTAFHGAAENPGVRTVVGVLRAALERVLRHPVDVTLAGRTDAGVHALGQVLSFDVVGSDVDVAHLARAVTSLAGPEVAVVHAAPMEADFDARFSALRRRYRYRLLHGGPPDPLRRDRVWHLRGRLEVRSMRLAADALIGEHDFSSFCRRPKGRDDASLIRTVRRIEILEPAPGELEVVVEADAFCHQMVRSIVGLLAAVGEGRVRAGEVRGILAARTRRAVPRVAPPQGLVLEAVDYPEPHATALAARLVGPDEAR